MTVTERKNDDLRNTIRLCNLASARLADCGKALRYCSRGLHRLGDVLERNGLDIATEASIMASLADTCDRSADRLCQAAGALAASDAPCRMLPALLPVLRWTQRLLTVAERRAAGMISILSAPQELPQSDSK